MKRTFYKIMTFALVLGLVLPAVPAGATRTQEKASYSASSNVENPPWKVKNPQRTAWEKKIRLTLKRRGTLRWQAAVFRAKLKSNAVSSQKKRQIANALRSHQARIRILSKQLSWTFAHKPTYYKKPPHPCKNGHYPNKHCEPVSPA